jgi:hypothetical protein
MSEQKRRSLYFSAVNGSLVDVEMFSLKRSTMFSMFDGSLRDVVLYVLERFVIQMWRKN